MSSIYRPIVLSWASILLLIANANAQQPAWLTEPAAPSLPPEGLLQPPPPLSPEMPASVIDEVAAAEAQQMRAPETAAPAWYYPWNWFPMDGWENSAELGINGSAGNAESFSFQTGARFKRKTDLHMFDLRITHNRTNAAGIETQNNSLAYADYERFLGDSQWTYFFKQGLEYDEFKTFDLRYNVNSGVGYSFFSTDDLTLIGRFGAGASREFGGPDNAWKPEALFGMDYDHQVNARNKLIAKADYFPEWTDFSNFRLIVDLSWEYLIDETGNLSLKLGAFDRYDSTPNGAKRNDVNYSALLLYKF